MRMLGVNLIEVAEFGAAVAGHDPGGRRHASSVTAKASWYVKTRMTLKSGRAGLRY
jgi:hypothetical protein